MMRIRRLQYQSCFLALLASSRTNATPSKVNVAAAFCQSSLFEMKSPGINRYISSPAFAYTKKDITSCQTTVRKMNSFGFDDGDSVPRIPREAMEEIIEDVANGGREDSGYVIIDVRGHDEVAQTGKLDEVVHTLPLPYIAEGALTMDEDDFEEQFGFVKPALDETIVFTCKAGIRSASAAKLAQMAGYTDILDYAGGSNEWFS
jgi:rhodanese-related sulfurtransferase